MNTRYTAGKTPEEKSAGWDKFDWLKGHRFHLSVTFDDDGSFASKRLIPNDVPYLPRLIFNRAGWTEEVSVFVVFRPKEREGWAWTEEPLERFEVALQEDGEVVHFFHLHGGEMFTNPPIAKHLVDGLADRKTLYYGRVVPRLR